jgi:hypothetical protein
MYAGASSTNGISPWDAKSVLIHTLPNTAFLRYRFGLIAAGEEYLDVDAVH